MSRFARLFRAAATAALSAAVATPAPAQQGPAAPPKPPALDPAALAREAFVAAGQPPIVSPAPVPTPAAPLLPGPVAPGTVGPRVMSPGLRGGYSYGCCPPVPCCPVPPGATVPNYLPGSPAAPSPGTNPGATPGTNPADMTAPPPTANQGVPNLFAGAGAGATAAPGGYLDNPIPITTFRTRYNAGFNMNRPDRSEYFYGAWQELGYHPHGINGKGPYFDPNVRGPKDLPGRLDFQDFSPYVELALNRRLSVFVEGTYRSVKFSKIEEDPEQPAMTPDGRVIMGANGRPLFLPEPNQGREEGTPEESFRNSGWGDVNFGFKYAVIADPDRYLTFQFRTYAPTGNAVLGLGTGHFSLEPGLLFYQRMGERWFVQGQFSDWIPLGGSKSTLDGTAFDGNILNYGLGLGYNAYSRGKWNVVPITEFVGWTCLGGLASVAEPINATAPPGLPYPPLPNAPANLTSYPLPTVHGIQDATGNTIINGKVGVRVYYGQQNSLYVGYGRALTGNRWYSDIFRLEYRWTY